MGLTANVADVADVSEYLSVVQFLSRAYARVLVAYQDTNAIAPALPPLHKLADTRQKANAEKATDAIRQAYYTLRTAPHLLSTHQRQIIDNIRNRKISDTTNIIRAARANIEKANAANRARFEAERAEQANRAAAAAADAAAFAAAPTGGDGATAGPVATHDRRQVPGGGFSLSSSLRM